MNPLTKPTTGIEDLPPEMINELFKHLHLKDLVACSLVNKRWYSIYAGFKVHRLAVTADKRQYPYSKWYQSEYWRAEDQEMCSDRKMFSRLLDRPLLSNLKHLALCGGGRPRIDLNQLNRFSQLVNLHVDLISLDEGSVHWNFLKLKVLVLDGVMSNRVPPSIDCPELSVLINKAEPNERSLDVKHPETIRKLETCMVGAQLAPFKGVECLVTEQFEAIDEATLQSLPKLKELHYKRPINQPFQDHSSEVGALERMKRTLREFVANAKALRGSDFKFCFAGFELTRVCVDEIDFGIRVVDESECLLNEYVYLKNYHLIDPNDTLEFISCLDYSNLIDVTRDIPSWVFKKLPGIRVITTSRRVKGIGHFFWFLKSVRSLHHLWLRHSRLGQEFYDQLPAFLPSLGALYLTESKKLQLDFDFIGQLAHLEQIEIELDYSPSFKVLTSLLRIPARLEARVELTFYFKEELCFVRKETGSRLWLADVPDDDDDDEPQTTFQSENQEEIVNFFEEL